jgi:hypothetical protein
MQYELFLQGCEDALAEFEMSYAVDVGRRERKELVSGSLHHSIAHIPQSIS